MHTLDQEAQERKRIQQRELTTNERGFESLEAAVVLLALAAEVAADGEETDHNNAQHDRGEGVAQRVIQRQLLEQQSAIRTTVSFGQFQFPIV